jgi:hypothetical protein
MLGLYASEVVAAQQPSAVPAFIIETGLRPLYAVIRPDQMEGILLPAFDRFLKRSSSSTLPLLLSLLHHVPLLHPALDVHRLALQPFLKALRVGDEHRVRVSLQLVELSAHCYTAEDHETLLAIVTELDATLHGQRGSVRSLDERVSIVRALAAIGASRDCPEAVDLAVNSLLTLVERDAHVDAHAAAIDALQSLLSATPT